MTHTLFKKTAFALGSGCFFGLMALALTTHPAQAQTQPAEKSYVAPGESNPTAVAKSKPGVAGGVSVKEKKPQSEPKQQAQPASKPKAQSTPKPQTQPTQKPQVKQKEALETLKKKVEADKSPQKTIKPAVETSELVQKVTYGDTIQDWIAKPGDTVQGLLLEWSEESGWTLISKLDKDYILEAGVVFRGTYMDVSMALLRSFARAVPAPIGTFYKGNRVLVVSTREDENEG